MLSLTFRNEKFQSFFAILENYRDHPSSCDRPQSRTELTQTSDQKIRKAIAHRDGPTSVIQNCVNNIGLTIPRETGRWMNNRAENSFL